MTIEKIYFIAKKIIDDSHDSIMQIESAIHTNAVQLLGQLCIWIENNIELPKDDK